MKKTLYKIVLVEPSVVVAEGIKKILIDNAQFDIVSEFRDFNRFVERLPIIKPDLVIINPKVVDAKSRAAIRNIIPTTALALIYDLFPFEFIKQFDDVINISDNLDKINKILSIVLEPKPETPSIAENDHELSDREKEILIAVASGFTNKEIANRHNISIYTVISHRKNITRKTGIKTVSGLTVYAMLNNLIEVN